MKVKLAKREGDNFESNSLDTVPIWKKAAFPAVFVLLAFLLRFFLIPQDTTINGDGIYYVSSGLKIISGNLNEGISAYWSPLYSFLIGISTLFFQDAEFAGRIVSVFAGSLLVIPTYFLIQEFFGDRPAYIGTTLVVIHPSLVASSGWVMTESLYALIFISAILVGWLAIKTVKFPMFFVSGLLLGSAYLTKPEAIFFVGLFAVLTLSKRFLCKKTNFRTLAAGCLFLLTGFVVFFLPYTIFIHQKTGIWTISQKFFSNSAFSDYDRGLLKLTDDGQTTMQDRIWLDDYVTARPETQHPISVAHDSAEAPGPDSYLPKLVLKAFNNIKRQLRIYTLEILPVPFILFAAIGLFLQGKTIHRSGEAIYLFSFVACTYLGYAVTVIELRYLYPLIPIFLGWVAFGIIAFSDAISKRCESYLKFGSKASNIMIQTSVLLVLIGSMGRLIAYHFAPPKLQDVPFEEKQAGLWLNQHSKPNSLVMARNATVAFYAGAKHIFLPDEEFSTILEYARRKNVDYIVLNERRLRDRPDTFRLAEELPWELNLVFQDRRVQNFELRIYRMAD